jgi:hypothetical protein
MLRRPTLLLVLSTLACSSNRDILQIGEHTYRLRCATSLTECLEQADTPCQQGFVVREGKDVRERAGIDVVGTGATEERSSEAVLVCRTDTLFDGDESDRPRLERQPICAPGSSQACVGPGGCSGGQSCLDDGTGYDRCDCGGLPTSPSATMPPPTPVPSAPPPETSPPPPAAPPTATPPAATAPPTLTASPPAPSSPAPF